MHLFRLQISNCLHVMQLDRLIPIFSELNMDGRKLSSMTVDQLEELGLDKLERIKVEKLAINPYRPS